MAGTRDFPDEKRCTGKAKSTDKRCRRERMIGKTKCYIHGGKSLRGIAHPNYRANGHYLGKDLPTRLAQHFEAQLKDPDLLSQRQSIALVGAFIAEMIPKLKTGESATLIEELRRLRADFVKESQEAALARQQGDKGKAQRHAVRAQSIMSEMMKLIDHGAEQGQIMREIGEQIDRYKSLKEAEAKRLINMQQVITADRANLMLGAVISIMMTVLRKHLDEKAARTIFADVSRGLDHHLLRLE